MHAPIYLPTLLRMHVYPKKQSLAMLRNQALQRRERLPEAVKFVIL